MWSTEPRSHEQQRRSRRTVLYKITVVCFACLRFFVVPSAQEAGKTVADGVYSEAQAARGAAAYETSCAGCHRADLGGGTGPALKEQRFARQFADKDLRTLFSRIATTMPRNAPGSLGDSVSLDIVAHLLKENGFPPGASELSASVIASQPASISACAPPKYFSRASVFGGSSSQITTRLPLAILSSRLSSALWSM